MGVNVVIFEGNLTRDPELKYIQAGKAVVQVTLAANEKFGERETVTFVDVTFWEKTAEIVAEYAVKGSKMTVEGRLKQDTWEDKDGNKRSKVCITATRMHLGAKPNSAKKDEPQDPDVGSGDGDNEGGDIPF